MAGAVVIGAQWGDEGKGKVIDYLSSSVDCVVRFQGGHNAGHTICAEGETIILHLVPSGILYQHISCCIGSGVAISPRALKKEIDLLVTAGIPVEGRLWVALNAPLILSSHQYIDCLSENALGENRIGTTGSGIGPAYEDKVGRRALHAFDLLDLHRSRHKIDRLITHHNSRIASLGGELIAPEKIYQELGEAASWIQPFLSDVSHLLLTRYAGKHQKVLFEGAQGALLDVTHGTYPFVTSSNCLAAAAAIGAGVPLTYFSSIIGVLKAYSTRVGEGPFPTELQGEVADYLSRVGGEVGATTGRLRRCGWFDCVAALHTASLNGFTHLILTKLDVLDHLPEIQVCVAYIDEAGCEHRSFPADHSVLKKMTPVYVRLPGWQQSTQQCRSVSELPEAAQNYIAFIAKAIGVSIAWVSVGPERHAILAVTDQVNLFG